MKAISNVSALQIFQILRYATLTLISVVFAKSHLSKLEIGEYETFIFIAGAATFFWITGIIKSFLANNKRTEKKTSDIFNLYIFILFLGILSFLAIKFISSGGINLLSYNYADKIAIYVLLLGTASISEYILLSLNKNKTLITYGVIAFSIQFAIVIYPVIIGKSIDMIINSLIIVVVLKNVFTLFLVLTYSKIQLSFIFIKHNIRFAIPLIISYLLSGSAQYIDGFIIKSYFDDNTFAVFRYGAKEFPLLILLSDAMSSVLVNEFSNQNKEIILQKLKEKSRKLVIRLFPISIILLICSNYLYKTVFSEEFVESAVIFDIYLLLIVSRLIFPQTIVIGLKKSKLILVASVLELTINVTLSLILVHNFGIMGVAFATVIAFYIEKLFLVIMVNKEFGISSSKYISFKSLIIYSVIIFIVFVTKYLIIV